MNFSRTNATLKMKLDASPIGGAGWKAKRQLNRAYWVARFLGSDGTQGSEAIPITTLAQLWARCVQTDRSLGF